MPLFKGENRQESISMVIGSILLVLGLVLLIVGFAMAFSVASNPSGYLSSHMPETEEQTKKAPRAEFRFTINDYSVSVEDTSQQGDAQINFWHWDFGDGQNADGRTPPPHSYSSNFSGNIRLTVKDGNNKESSALGNVQVGPGQHVSGNSSPDIGDIGNMFSFNDLLGPLMSLPFGFVAGFLAFLALLIVWLVGASILKAGWNLIRPRPETIRVRIKPRDIQVEPVHPTTYATPQPVQQFPPSPQYPPVTEQPPMQPPPPEP